MKGREENYANMPAWRWFLSAGADHLVFHGRMKKVENGNNEIACVHCKILKDAEIFGCSLQVHHFAQLKNTSREMERGNIP